jgi:creatinine amidohydrolase
MPTPLRLLRCFTVALAVAACGAPAAQSMGSVHLEELTWTELRDRVKAGATTVIVPIGGTEQNGPAMVLGKHNVRVRLLAGRIAAGLGGQALVAPVVAYVPEGEVDPPTAHMRFPGTITLPEPAFETMLEYAARSFRRHGFRDVVLIGDHGGYRRSMKRVADKLNREWAATPVRVHALDDYYQAATEGHAAALRERGFSDAEIGSHAGLADTSLSMAVDPRLVRTERLREGRPGPADGVQGDPTRATAELGELPAERIVARSIAAIQRAVARR